MSTVIQTICDNPKCRKWKSSERSSDTKWIHITLEYIKEEISFTSDGAEFTENKYLQDQKEYLDFCGYPCVIEKFRSFLPPV
jgi:hypothetical protein